MVKVVFNIEDANCITHSGTMHADEVFATAFLDLYLGDVRVYRTNNIDINKVSDNTLVYDVGRGKFDHHQIDALKRENGITYSSFGLLWKEFGRDFLKKSDFSNVEEMFLGIDKDLVEGIDADDNGIFPKIEADYKVKTLSNVVKLFNPGYDSFEDESLQFELAVSICQKIFIEELYYINGKVVAEEKINDILSVTDINSKYLILDEFIPYEDALLKSEYDNILFVAFPSNRGGYAIKTVPKGVDDRTSRMSFPEEWAGKTDYELESISGIKGLRFCHVGRFIVSCVDLDTVYKVLDSLCGEE